MGSEPYLKVLNSHLLSALACGNNVNVKIYSALNLITSWTRAIFNTGGHFIAYFMLKADTQTYIFDTESKIWKNIMNN